MGVRTGEGARGQVQPQGMSMSPSSWPTWPTPPFLLHRDVRALGITLMGHQKKILSSIQTMRAQLTGTQGPRRHL